MNEQYATQVHKVSGNDDAIIDDDDDDGEYGADND